MTGVARTPHQRAGQKLDELDDVLRGWHRSRSRQHQDGIIGTARKLVAQLRELYAEADAEVADAFDARPRQRTCSWCGRPMPEDKRAHATTCSKSCRQAKSRGGLPHRRMLVPFASLRRRRAPPSSSSTLATPAGDELVDERTRVELGRLSAPKLDEPWTARDAQKQVLSNVLRGRDVSRATRAMIALKMSGRPLRDLGLVVAAELDVGATLSLQVSQEQLRLEEPDWRSEERRAKREQLCIVAPPIASELVHFDPNDAKSDERALCGISLEVRDGNVVPFAFYLDDVTCLRCREILAARGDGGSPPSIAEHVPVVTPQVAWAWSSSSSTSPATAAATLQSEPSSAGAAAGAIPHPQKQTQARKQKSA